MMTDEICTRSQRRSPDPLVGSESTDRSIDLEVRRVRWPIWGPLFAMIGVSAIIRIFDIDLSVSDLCYDRNRRYWPFDTAQPWLWFYRNGTLPPLILGIGGGLVFLFGTLAFRNSDPVRIQRARRAGLFLALLLLIGPGLLVNSSLKMMWGRPRPWQCEQFGGEFQFVPVGELGTTNIPNSSFPSGHAAVAFFLMGLGFVVSPNRPWLRGLCFFGGIAYGMAMGITRVMQGGHFTSDVLWAGAIVYFVAVGLSRMLLLERD
jgi:lipid A 4'-phosphatase